MRGPRLCAREHLAGVKDSVSGNPARPSTLYFWEVTPSFEAVPRELLGA